MVKEISSPYATGGKGYLFESHAQASYSVLMLTGGYPPSLPDFSIEKINLQTRTSGYQTDDMLVICKNKQTNQKTKLLINIKITISFTESNKKLSEVIAAAWADYNNNKIFTQGRDKIFLITEALTNIDTKAIDFICSQAKYQQNTKKFVDNIKKKKSSPPKCEDKFKVIQYNLKIANDDKEVSLTETHKFLKHFYVISYDLGKEESVILSLIQSHISQFNFLGSVKSIWANIVESVQYNNKNAGSITKYSFPEDIQAIFARKETHEMPEEFIQQPAENKPLNTEYDSYLARLIFIGSWDANNNHDIEIINDFMLDEHQDWQPKTKQIINLETSPLNLKNGIWKVNNRIELLSELATQIFDDDLDKIQCTALNILQEIDNTNPDDLYGNYGRNFKYSTELRQGIADGIAILSVYQNKFKHCDRKKCKYISSNIIDNLLRNSSWQIWASLNNLLPSLAEIAPDFFLKIIEETVNLEQSPFNELFARETGGAFGNNNMIGLLWALEGLAWNPEYLVRVCLILAKLATKDPSNYSTLDNRPFNSLKTILLPWLPHTLADSSKRKNAVNTLIKEFKKIAWEFLLLMISGRIRSTSETHKTKWRKFNQPPIKITHQEYREQLSFFAESAIKIAENKIDLLKELIAICHCFDQSNFNKLSKVLKSTKIIRLTENERLTLWEQLIKLVRDHEKYYDADWALPTTKTKQLKQLAKKLQPKDLFCLYSGLFVHDDFDLYEGKGDFEEQRKLLQIKRDKAIKNIFQKHKMSEIIKFATDVQSQFVAGYSLGVLNNKEIEQYLLPDFLDKNEPKHKNLISGYIWRKQQDNSWLDQINKQLWTTKQICQFLIYLPFTQTTWQRVDKWLSKDANKYWANVIINHYNKNDDFNFAIEQLIENKRFNLAVECLDRVLYKNETSNIQQCIKALTGLASENISDYMILRLIAFLQDKHTKNEKEKVIAIEWKFIKIFKRHDYDHYPKLLQTKMAQQPEFFTKEIQLAYKSKDSGNTFQYSVKKSEKASWLLHNWKIIPGIKEEKFKIQEFNTWFNKVKEICKQTGHLQVALKIIGEVFFYAIDEKSDIWLDNNIAEILNQDKNQDMLRSFITKIYNSRGAYLVDKTGNEDKQLANKYRRYAYASENNGFSRLATALRGLARDYDEIAEDHINEFS